jgi:hypothetical protein
VIERALILAGGRIEAEHLNLETGSSPFTDKGLLRASERELITKTLSETGGNRKKRPRYWVFPSGHFNTGSESTGYRSTCRCCTQICRNCTGTPDQ